MIKKRNKIVKFDYLLLLKNDNKYKDDLIMIGGISICATDFNSLSEPLVLAELAMVLSSP